MPASDAILAIQADGGRGICPACDGGSSHERSLKVWSDGVFTYAKCFRNSCGKRWKLLGGAPVEREQRERVINRKLVVQDNGFLERTKGLAGQPYPCEIGGREGLCYELRGPSGDLKGWNVRHTDGKAPKSTLVYRNTEPGRREVGWFSNALQAPTKPLLIVEDCASALLASRFVPAVALCGTWLTLEAFSDILRESGSKFNGSIVFALDRDAYTRGLMYQQMFSVLASCSVLELERDIKDLTDKQIEVLLI